MSEVQVTRLTHNGRLRFSINNGLDLLDAHRHSVRQLEIVDLKVMSERRKGRGRMLFEEVEHYHRLLWRSSVPFLFYAFVRASNEGALAFYQAVGMQEMVRVPGFYLDFDNGPDQVAVLMGKKVSS